MFFFAVPSYTSNVAAAVRNSVDQPNVSPPKTKIGNLNRGLYDKILFHYKKATSKWVHPFKKAASRLFWLLAIISLVWTLGTHILKKADIGELFAEFIRFIIFIGFYWWLLQHGSDIAKAILNSFANLGSTAASVGTITPSQVLDKAFEIYRTSVKPFSFFSAFDQATSFILVIIIFILLAIIASNFLILMCAVWILAYAGIFFLGFGGSKWTSDIAINYYKTILGLGAELMTMILLIGLGYDMLAGATKIIENSSTDTSHLTLLSLLGMIIVLFLLCNKIPSFVASIITTATIGSHAGIGTFGGGVVAGMAPAVVNSALTAKTMIKDKFAGVIPNLKSKFQASEKDQNKHNFGDIGIFGSSKTNNDPFNPTKSRNISGPNIDHYG